MEVCNKVDNEDLKIDIPELKPEVTEKVLEKLVLNEETLKSLNEAIKPISPEVAVLQESQKSEIKSIVNLKNRMKKKKKRKKNNHKSSSIENKSILVEKEDVLPNSKSDVLCNGEDLCIRDFEVEISSFNLSKPVLLNLDTYSIEPSITTIEDVVSVEPALPELTENLEVSLDPNLFFPELLEEVQIVDLVEESSESDVSPPKEIAEVSLLTSSDEDDVILQEPYIETIEVSDACSDDEPLAKLLNLQAPMRNGKKLKRKLKKYTCHVCSFWTYGKLQYNKHLSTHDWYFCTKCEFACGTERKLSRHYKTHIFSFLFEKKSKGSRKGDGNVESGKVKKVNSNKRKKKSQVKDYAWTPSVEI